MSVSETPVVHNEAGRRFSSEPAGYLLNRFSLLAVLAGLVLAAWNRQAPIAILFGLVLSAAGLSRLWSRLSLKGVHCERSLSERRAFPDESIEMKLRVVNRKLLPLPWIQVDDELPYGLARGIPLLPAARTGTGVMSKTTALLWYSRVSWRQTLQCSKRGYYTLGPVQVTSGDIFGFYPRSATEKLVDHVIVYPRIYEVARPGIPSLHPLGETKAERRIFEDPSRTIGVREYTPGDSLRRIHWKASARHQQLQVKIFEPTTTLKVALFLVIDSFRHDDPQAEADFELGISAAASIANYITEQGSLAGLFVNTLLADSSQPVVIPPGSGRGQLVAMLEALAKVTSKASSPFEDFLKDSRRRLPWGTTLIFIFAKSSDALVGTFAGLKEKGHRLLALQIGEQAATIANNGLAWHNVRNPNDLLIFGSGGAH